MDGARTKFTPEQIQRDSRFAIDAAFESMRTLLAKRSDLLTLDSAERSMQILLNDHQGAEPEVSPLSEISDSAH
jgi:hypothetical protein